MADLYDAIGTLAAAAHANGDDIDQNVVPGNSGDDRHGLNVFSNGRYLQFRDVPNEPRFIIKSPLAVSAQLRNRYTPGELSD